MKKLYMCFILVLMSVLLAACGGASSSDVIGKWSYIKTTFAAGYNCNPPDNAQFLSDLQPITGEDPIYVGEGKTMPTSFELRSDKKYIVDNTTDTYEVNIKDGYGNISFDDHDPYGIKNLGYTVKFNGNDLTLSDLLANCVVEYQRVQ